MGCVFEKILRSNAGYCGYDVSIRAPREGSDWWQSNIKRAKRYELYYREPVRRASKTGSQKALKFFKELRPNNLEDPRTTPVIAWVLEVRASECRSLKHPVFTQSAAPRC